MSSVLRPIRKRKKSRTLGPVEIIRREDYAELELDAKVELIRSLVPLGLMHVEEVLDAEVTALAGERYARKDASVGGRRHGSNPGTVGLAGQRVPIRVPADSPCRGERDAAAVVCGVAWGGCGQRPIAEAGAVRHLVPQLRGRRRGDSRGHRAVGVHGVPDLYSSERDAAPRAPGARPVRGGRRGDRAGREDVRRCRRWSSRWGSR